MSGRGRKRVAGGAGDRPAGRARREEVDALFALPKNVRVGILERLPLRDLRALCNAGKKFALLLCGDGMSGDAAYPDSEYMAEVWQAKLRDGFGTALRADECRARTARERVMVARSLEAYLAGTRGLEHSTSA